MKYIRIEDGIYEIVDFDYECIIPSPIIKMNGRLTHCCDYKNCKQADTIVELCDEFVLVEKMREVTYHHKSSEFADFKSIAMLNERYTLYGAIWTDKGIIYVAKMNNKGELELI